MTFTTPLALLGLLSLPLIFVLHMMRSRSRRFTVSSLSLWSFLDPQVRGARARRIPLTWLLLLDLLIAALLTLALANPEIQLTRREEVARHTIVLLDISTSMAATDEPGSRLQAAISGIDSLLQNRLEGDIFTLITFDASARTLGDTRRDDPEALLARLRGQVPTGAGANLEAALALAKASMDSALPAQVHVFTDAAFPSPQHIPTDLPLVWHLAGESGDNQAVLALAAERLSEQKFQVFARIANFADLPAARQATLYAGSSAVGSVDLTLEPRSSLAQSWDVVGNPAFLQVVLEGSDDLPLDDRASLGFPGTARLSAALVSNRQGALLQALQALPGLDLQVIAPEEYLPGGPYDLTVFSGFLPEAWPPGYVIVADPPEASSLLGQATLVPIGTAPYPRPDPLLVDVDFTGLRWGNAWRLSNLPVGLAALAAGRLPLIVRFQDGATHVSLLLPEIMRPDGSPTTFARHPAFPIILANAAGLAAGAGFPDQLDLGQPLSLPDFEEAPSLTIQPPSGDPLRFGADRPADWTGADQPGLYRVSFTDPGGQVNGALIGVNAGDLDESNISPGQFPTGSNISAAGTIETEQPVSLAAWVLGLVGLLLLVEAWLAWK